MHRPPAPGSLTISAFALLALAASAAGDDSSGSGAWPPWVHRGARLSAAYERMLRDQIEAGRILSPEIIRRFGLDRPDSDALPAAAPDEAPRGRPETPLGPGTALRPDGLANDRSGDGPCAGCGGRPLSQSETTIAALGDFAVAGWNNTRGFCTGGAIQGYATSVDGGATWLDHGDPPALPGGGRYRGDPVHGVNRKTGDFYICGLYEGGSPGSGLALARGHFSAGAFAIDDNQLIAFGGPNFLDKEWMAADSLTGNLYVTYSNFVGGSLSQIEFIRRTPGGGTWETPIVMNAPAANNLVQGSRPAVGPGGEVYVVWYEQGYLQSHMRIRRSDDFGASFGPERTVCDFYENAFSGSPGFRRAFGIALPGIAVDASSGPHRGRVYVTWDESVNYTDAPFTSSTAKSEVEKNDFFAAATPFDVGDVVRGAFASTSDIDLFRFSGLRGQTIFFRTDSATSSTATNMRLVCASDTSTFNAYRLLAFSQGLHPALVFTLPADGVYYLRLNSASSFPPQYVISTTFDTPSPGERARDHRDHLVSFSDDGISWSAPHRLNDDPPWFDGVYPEVTVDGTGAVHCTWIDFRDDPGCGAESYQYMVSSGDGGMTWGPNRRVSDARSFWSFNACGSANQGDYQGITSDGATVFPCWSDSRLGDPDVFAERPSFARASACPPPALAPAGSPLELTFTLENQGNVAGDFEWSVEDDGGWLTGAAPAASGAVTLAAGGSQQVAATFAVPEICPPEPDVARFIIRDVNIPGRDDTCATTIYCVSSSGIATGPRAELWLAAPEPNPSRGVVGLRFSLSRPGPARLEIFGPGGARIRSLAGGAQGAGEHRIAWDGLDDRGRRVAPGVCYVRLEAEHRRLTRRLNLIR